ncbi:AEC family transporter [Microbacterium sp. EST19A]|uniref:AEC family transporter n=1 Tax=Microbacterium sp. EST19A TaxID=2862681 RepID=UPI001CBCE046|nr:AEC family transporter [Microbacterium sp. EST19A]
MESFTGFTVVAVAILVGWIVGRTDLLGEHARPVLARLAFFVLSPFLLFVVLAQADVDNLFSALLPVSAIVAATVIAVYVLIARFAWRRSVGETVIGALSAGQVNSSNIGIPVSLYLLGSAAYPAPLILMQLLVFTPITMMILDAATTTQTSLWRVIVRVATNPIVVASVLGTLVAVSGIELPAIVLQPADLIADACVPLLLIAYGMSLHGQRIFAPSGRRRDIVLATTLNLIVMPVLAWGVARFVFGLSAHDVLVVTVLAALPTAQNVFNYSQRYDVGETISRDTVFLTTIGSVPILIFAPVLLG